MAKKENPKDDPRTRMRAAVTYLNSRSGERTKLFAFLSIMHPDMPLERRLRLVNEAYPKLNRK